ncbi:uncharacterized protein [Parasteatoda tepidariorum]|uniref:uncharacterized protein n=1 Tax=Parasteatoda tepidariorum TaxID=114398 RepID=UPI0039BCE5D8
MKAVTGFVLCCLIIAATCKLRCFKSALSRCHAKQRISEDITYCQNEIAMHQCQLNASLECGLGFDSTARQAISALTDVCTNGTESNKAIKSDKNCTMATLTDSGEECSADLSLDMKGLKRYEEHEVNKVICRHLNGVKNCLFQKFVKCNNTTQNAFKHVIETSIALELSLCTFFKDD